MVYKKTVKNSIKIAVFLFIGAVIYGSTLYSDYENCEKQLKAGNYSAAEKSAYDIMEQYPDYLKAKVLYYKAVHYQGKAAENEGIYKEIINSSEEVRTDLMQFFIDREDVEHAEDVYNKIGNKDDFLYKIAEFMYRKKLYSKVVRDYPDKKIVALIEKDKNLADSYYFEAMNIVKKDKKNTAMAEGKLESAIKVYPVNYIYYYKLGQMYADSKNFYLAEYNFQKALEYYQAKEIYLNLFRLYSENNEYEMIYKIAPFVIEYPEVKIKLQQMYKEQKSLKNRVKIAKIDENKIYIDARVLPKVRIGDALYIENSKNSIYDKVSGEKLYEIREKVCKVRVYDINEKMAVFYIVEKYLPIDISEDYILIN